MTRSRYATSPRTTAASISRSKVRTSAEALAVVTLPSGLASWPDNEQMKTTTMIVTIRTCTTAPPLPEIPVDASRLLNLPNSQQRILACRFGHVLEAAISSADPALVDV